MPCGEAPPGIANRRLHTARVWRYPPIDHFEDLLETGTLYLRRLDCLHELDPNEGRWMPGAERLVIPGVDEPAGLIAAHEDARDRTFTSCWTARLNERHDMWAGGSRDVAISTCYGELIHALADSPHDLVVGAVCYIDTVEEYVDRSQRANSYRLSFRKGRKFEHEQEVRVLYQEHSAGPLESHVRTPIDIARLNPTVVLRPCASDVFAARVRRLIESNGQSIEVEHSMLDG